jgi:hypothetical protein
MSSTKIVIIVLVLVGVLFVIFVACGALRNDPPPPQKVDSKAAKKAPTPGWAEPIKGLFSSLQPKALVGKVYTVSTTDTIPPDPDGKQPFRTVTFLLKSGRAKISYEDATPLKSDNPLKDMDRPQTCPLPQEDDEVKDKMRCSILALKLGGKLTFTCDEKTTCKVVVE